MFWASWAERCAILCWAPPTAGGTSSPTCPASERARVSIVLLASTLFLLVYVVEWLLAVRGGGGASFGCVFVGYHALLVYLCSRIPGINICLLFGGAAYRSMRAPGRTPK